MAEEKGDEARCGSHGAPTVEEGRTARATAVAAAAAGAPAASEAQRGTEAPTAEEAEGENTETHAAAETSAEADGGCFGAPTVTATGPDNFRNVKFTTRAIQSPRGYHASHRTTCRTAKTSLGKRSEHPVSEAPATCSRLSYVEPSWTSCSATNALPDHEGGSW